MTSNVIDPLIKDYIRKNFLLYASALRSSKLVLFDMSWQWFWIKCISFQAVTARRHVCFVKITQFIHIFPRNWIQFERQSCRIFFYLPLFKNNKDGLMGPTQRELHYGSSLDTKRCVLRAQAVVLFWEACWGFQAARFFHLATAFLFHSYYILPLSTFPRFLCSY